MKLFQEAAYNVNNENLGKSVIKCFYFNVGHKNQKSVMNKLICIHILHLSKFKLILESS